MCITCPCPELNYNPWKVKECEEMTEKCYVLNKCFRYTLQRNHIGTYLLLNILKTPPELPINLTSLKFLSASAVAAYLTLIR